MANDMDRIDLYLLRLEETLSPETLSPRDMIEMRGDRTVADPCDPDAFLQAAISAASRNEGSVPLHLYRDVCERLATAERRLMKACDDADNLGKIAADNQMLAVSLQQQLDKAHGAANGWQALAMLFALGMLAACVALGWAVAR